MTLNNKVVINKLLSNRDNLKIELIIGRRTRLRQFLTKGEIFFKILSGVIPVSLKKGSNRGVNLDKKIVHLLSLWEIIPHTSIDFQVISQCLHVRKCLYFHLVYFCTYTIKHKIKQQKSVEIIHIFYITHCKMQFNAFVTHYTILDWLITFTL